MIDDHGLTITYTTTTGPAWRCTSIARLSRADGGNTPAIYVRVWNADGTRARDDALRIRASVPGQPVRTYPLDKPDSSIERGHGDVPLARSAVYAISIIDGAGHDSDIVDGLRSDQPLPGEDWGHVTWRLEFALQGSDPIVIPPDPPTEPDCEALRGEMRAWLAEGEALAEAQRGWLARLGALVGE